MSLRDKWLSRHRPREVRMVRVMGIPGDKVRINGGGQVLQAFAGHGNDTDFNSECNEKVLEGFEQR